MALGYSARRGGQLVSLQSFFNLPALVSRVGERSQSHLEVGGRKSGCVLAGALTVSPAPALTQDVTGHPAVVCSRLLGYMPFC